MTQNDNVIMLIICYVMICGDMTWHVVTWQVMTHDDIACRDIIMPRNAKPSSLPSRHRIRNSGPGGLSARLSPTLRVLMVYRGVHWSPHNIAINHATLFYRPNYYDILFRDYDATRPYQLHIKIRLLGGWAVISNVYTGCTEAIDGRARYQPLQRGDCL